MKSIKIGNLTLRVPVIQGGMGVGISLSGLAAAVANEGGVGVISSAGLGLLYKNFSTDYLKASIYGLKEEIRKAREKSKEGVIGVNVMVAMSNFADMVKTAIQEKADIIFSGAGLPLDMPSFLQKDSTTKLVPIVSSARAAKIICQKWKSIYNYLPDAIVVEGPKAGGHLGYSNEQLGDPAYSLEAIVPEVVAAAREIGEQHGRYIPVIAKAAGFGNIGEKVVQHQKRKFGTTKFGMNRFVRGYLDLLTITFISKFGKRPMHLFGGLGSILFLAGFIMGIYLVFQKIFNSVYGMTDRPLFYLALICMIIGSQFFLTGFLAELVQTNSANKKQYGIAEKI